MSNAVSSKCPAAAVDKSITIDESNQTPADWILPFTDDNDNNNKSPDNDDYLATGSMDIVGHSEGPLSIKNVKSE